MTLSVWFSGKPILLLQPFCKVNYSVYHGSNQSTSHFLQRISLGFWPVKLVACKHKITFRQDWQKLDISVFLMKRCSGRPFHGQGPAMVNKAMVNKPISDSDNVRRAEIKKLEACHPSKCGCQHGSPHQLMPTQSQLQHLPLCTMVLRL